MGRRVLVVVNGPLGERMAAPEVRGLEMARELSRRHAVTVATRARFDRRALVAEARRSDVVIAPRVPPYLFAALAGADTKLVADLYNPTDLELADLAGRPEIRRALVAGRVAHRLQLRFADVILCAVESQRRRLAEQLARVARPGGAPLLRVVPFGIGDDPPPSDRRPLRARFPAIRPGDTVVLWWGNVWRWFDADTAIAAVARLARTRPGLRLVISAGRTPREGRPEIDRTDAAIALAERLRVLGRSVFFLDDWVPQPERHHYLLEADVGLTLARATPEREQAARGRYMDYLWASLPCVLGAGDDLSERFARAGFALTVAPGDVDGACRALAALVDDPRRRASARAARDALAERFRWPVAVEPLMEAIERLAGAKPARGAAPLALAADLRAYYARRLALR